MDGTKTPVTITDLFLSAAEYNAETHMLSLTVSGVQEPVKVNLEDLVPSAATTKTVAIDLDYNVLTSDVENVMICSDGNNNISYLIISIVLLSICLFVNVTITKLGLIIFFLLMMYIDCFIEHNSRNPQTPHTVIKNHIYAGLPDFIF